MKSPEAIMPGDWWQIDLIQMERSARGFHFILVVIDLFTGFVLTRPLKTKTSSETAANIFQIYTDFGPPRVVQSDSGAEFVNAIFSELSELAGVEIRTSTPYYKHSTGAVERVNRTISASLKKMLRGALADWDRILPLVTRFYNTTTRSLTKSMPFALMFNRPPNAITDNETHLMTDDFNLDRWCEENSFDTWLPAHKRRLDDLIQSHKRVLQHVYPTIKQQVRAKRRRQADRFDSTHAITTESLKPGQKCLIVDEKRNSKWDPNWVGPFVIQSVTNTGSYILQNFDGTLIQRARSQIKPFVESEHDDRQSYQVERILSHQGSGPNTKYLVKWKGYSDAFNSWVDSSDFDDFSLVSHYHRALDVAGTADLSSSSSLPAGISSSSSSTRDGSHSSSSSAISNRTRYRAERRA